MQEAVNENNYWQSMTTMSSFAFQCKHLKMKKKQCADNIEDIYFIKYDSNEKKANKVCN